jgi:hypothetical protein
LYNVVSNTPREEGEKGEDAHTIFFLSYFQYIILEAVILMELIERNKTGAFLDLRLPRQSVTILTKIHYFPEHKKGTECLFSCEFRYWFLTPIFNNISIISWRAILFVVKTTGVK